VNENEILFARRELPHYLNETILNGHTRVTVTPSGERPPQMVPQDVDETLSRREHRQILDSAINEFIDKFGVDPSAPKVQIIDGEPYTNDEAQKLVERETIDPGKVVSEQSAVPHSPNPVGGTVRVHILEASDNKQPHEPWYDASDDAWDRFSTFGPIDDPLVSAHYGQWEPAEEGEKATKLIDHLKENQDDYQRGDNHLVAGWVDHADHNGIGKINGFYSVSAVTATGINVDWPHDSIFQHELSHNFGADHPGNGIGCINPTCIMNYVAARAHGTEWCNGCHDDVGSEM
jgi:hypothetical protein